MATAGAAFEINLRSTGRPYVYTTRSLPLSEAPRAAVCVVLPLYFDVVGATNV